MLHFYILQLYMQQRITRTATISNINNDNNSSKSCIWRNGSNIYTYAHLWYICLLNLIKKIHMTISYVWQTMSSASHLETTNTTHQYTIHLRDSVDFVLLTCIKSLSNLPFPLFDSFSSWLPCLSEVSLRDQRLSQRIPSSICWSRTDWVECGSCRCW